MSGNAASSLFGAIAAAVVASICCVVPLMLLALGIGGAWISGLRAVEPYRPLFIVAALAFLGSAFYQVYRRPRIEECEPGTCGNPRPRTIRKGILWVVTVLIGGLLFFPYIAPRLHATQPALDGNETTRVTLALDNMSCPACPITVRQSLLQVTGVLDARITLEPPEAIVVFDPGRVSAQDLIQATTSAGYPSSVQEKRGS